MSAFTAALRCELLKARRSPLPALAAAGFSLAPVMAAVFMLILKDPALARRLGLITAKAQLVAGTADWPTFLGVIAQAIAVGGSFVFSLVTAWTFGREFSDRTVKLIVATPTPRRDIVAAKLAVVALLCIGMTMWVLLLGIGLGALLGLPGGSAAVMKAGAVTALSAGALTVALVPVIALIAGIGRGYMAPLGFAILMVFLAQVLTATGWGARFPWAVPPLHAGMAGAPAEMLDRMSYIVLVATGAAGLAATLWWWQTADQTT
ncbi:MAG TPA: ABC transporter permease [Longimicrobiales bacterium]